MNRELEIPVDPEVFLAIRLSGTFDGELPKELPIVLHVVTFREKDGDTFTGRWMTFTARIRRWGLVLGEFVAHNDATNDTASRAR